MLEVGGLLCQRRADPDGGHADQLTHLAGPDTALGRRRLGLGRWGRDSMVKAARCSRQQQRGRGPLPAALANPPLPCITPPRWMSAWPPPAWPARQPPPQSPPALTTRGDGACMWCSWTSRQRCSSCLRVNHISQLGESAAYADIARCSGVSSSYAPPRCVRWDRNTAGTCRVVASHRARTVAACTGGATILDASGCAAAA